ncbi:hypothetical protein ES703_109648 [subsurface metagenome]
MHPHDKLDTRFDADLAGFLHGALEEKARIGHPGDGLGILPLKFRCILGRLQRTKEWGELLYQRLSYMGTGRLLARLSIYRGYMLLHRLVDLVAELLVRHLQYPGHRIIVKIQEYPAHEHHAGTDVSSTLARDLSLTLYRHYVVYRAELCFNTELAVGLDCRCG